MGGAKQRGNGRPGLDQQALGDPDGNCDADAEGMILAKRSGLEADGKGSTSLHLTPTPLLSLEGGAHSKEHLVYQPDQALLGTAQPQPLLSKPTWPAAPGHNGEGVGSPCASLRAAAG